MDLWEVIRLQCESIVGSKAERRRPHIYHALGLVCLTHVYIIALGQYIGGPFWVILDLWRYNGIVADLED